MAHPLSVYRLAKAKTKLFIDFCYMVSHWLKIAIQTLHDTENMVNTDPLCRLFRLSTHFLQIEGNGKEGKVHFDLVFSKISESFVAVVSLHLSKDRLWFDAPTTSMLYSNLRCQPIWSELLQIFPTI